MAKLPGDLLLAGLMAAYTKNGIFASLFILHSVSAAPKPWCYALYVPGSGWGVFSTWDLCAAHGAIGGSRARHSEDFFGTARLGVPRHPEPDPRTPRGGSKEKADG